MIGSRLLGRYELTAELGRGGMGVVFAGRDPLLDRDVAIKVIQPESWNEEIEERFEREARSVARMDHPSIVPIFDFGRHQGSLFFVMPLVTGETLHELIARRSLKLDETLRIAVRVAEALDYSHAHGIVHRDIKPANIMITRDAEELRVRVMDFGLARTVTDASMSGSVTAIGTPDYLSPEQILGEPLDGRSDLYSLGTVLYECLAGEPPFRGSMFSVVTRILHEKPRSLRDRGLAVDEELDQIVAACLAKSASQRPARGAELAERLTRYREKLRARATGTPSVSTARTPAPSSPLLPLCGREAEMAQLRGRLEMALAGECQLVLVGGEPGIGKTRLTQELENVARGSGIRVLKTRLVDRESSMPYEGFCELIQDYFRFRGVEDSSPHALPDFSGIASDLVQLFPVLAEIRELHDACRAEGAPYPDGRAEGAPYPDGRSESLPDSELAAAPLATAPPARPPAPSRPTLLFETLAKTIALMAGGGALVLVLEQLHDADASLDALRYVVHRLGPSPILIVGTYRATEVDRQHPVARLARSFSDDPRFNHLVLTPLSARAFRELVEHEVGSSELDESFLDEIMETAEGNPYFALELTRSYLESGSLSQDEQGVFQITGAASRDRPPLPPTIQQTVETRIERLSPGVRHVLHIASVLGKSFEYRDLEELMAKWPGPSGDPAPDKDSEAFDLDQALDFLVARGLLEEGRRRRGDWMSFSSGVIREVLYQGLSRRRRKLLHRHHALALERRNAGRLDRVYPRLLHHFSEAEMADKTVEYATLLAEKALEAWSPADALSALETALDLVGDVARPRVAEGELRALLARTHRAMGRHDQALAEAARAAGAFERTKARGEVADVALLAAETAWQARRVEDLTAWVERGLEPARRAGSIEVLERLLTLGATVANLRGEYEAASRYLEEAEELGGSTVAIRLSVRDAQRLRQEPAIARGGTLVTASRSALVNLDPAAVKTLEEQEIAGNAFETLVASDAEGNLVPWLCQGWRGSDDTTVFELPLRGDVTFSDGSSLSARDVQASLERSARRRYYSPPPALAAIRGVDEFLAGRADHIRGIEIGRDGGAELVRFCLKEPLPIFPATLTDLKTAIVRQVEGAGDAGTLLGTGPFRITHHDANPLEPGRVILVRYPGYWRGPSPNLAKIEVLTLCEAPEIAEGLRSGEIDLARDLDPHDLEELLRDPKFRAGWVEATTRSVYFLLVNSSGPVLGKVRERDPHGKDPIARALFESVRVHDLTWRSLSRYAQPASSLIPPGVLGHDPGRRRPALRLEEARELVRSSGLGRPVTLRAAVHPMFRDRFAVFFENLRDLWSRLGLEVSNETPTLKSYISCWAGNDDIDLFLGRWTGEYDDPDSYTFALFHSRYGVLRRYYSAPEVDRVAGRARRERHPAGRQALYRQLEALLDEDHAVLPLFYDVDDRIAGTQVLGLRLSNTRPYVNYSELGKRDSPPAASPHLPEPVFRASGEIHVPLPGRIDAVDPLDGDFADHLEVTSNVYESLTRIDEGARAVPWLALSCEAQGGGRSYRFVLPPRLRFHDGRLLTSRDVRYTYERALRSRVAEIRHLLLPVRGARDFAAGESSELSGLTLASATELTIELERPLEIFPALLAHSCLAIVPEGVVPGGISWRDGCAGTGPFRVVGLTPGERLELERNPQYRRPDLPRAERLVFHFDVGTEKAVRGLEAGRYSLASHLRPRDLEALRRNPEIARGSHEAPSLSTFFLVFNTRRGPLADRERRRHLLRGLEVSDLVEAALGRRVTPARGLIPPGLLGSHTFGSSLPVPLRGSWVPARLAEETGSRAPASRRVTLRAAVHPAFKDEYADFWDLVPKRLFDEGFDLEVNWATRPEISERSLGAAPGRFDLAIDRGYAYYPDADQFAMGLVHSVYGRLSGFFSSPEIDRLSEEGRWEGDPEKRHWIYREIERIFEDEAFLVPLFHEHTHIFLHPRVKGFRSGFSFPSIRYERLTVTP